MCSPLLQILNCTKNGQKVMTNLISDKVGHSYTFKMNQASRRIFPHLGLLKAKTITAPTTSKLLYVAIYDMTHHCLRQTPTVHGALKQKPSNLTC